MAKKAERDGLDFSAEDLMNDVRRTAARWDEINEAEERQEHEERMARKERRLILTSHYRDLQREVYHAKVLDTLAEKKRAIFARLERAGKSGQARLLNFQLAREDQKEKDFLVGIIGMPEDMAALQVRETNDALREQTRKALALETADKED